METQKIQSGAYYNPMLDLKWSQGEKRIARNAFETALHHELQKTLDEAKQRTARITEPSQLWELEDWLGKRRREINEKYDYRYSVLPEIFARLIYEGRLSEEDLEGLGADKMETIQRYVRFAKER